MILDKRSQRSVRTSPSALYRDEASSAGGASIRTALPHAHQVPVIAGQSFAAPVGPANFIQRFPTVGVFQAARTRSRSAPSKHVRNYG